MLPGKAVHWELPGIDRFFKYRKIALDKSCFVCYYNKALRGQVLHRNTGDAGKMLV